jgi:hypothetical protein
VGKEVGRTTPLRSLHPVTARSAAESLGQRPLGLLPADRVPQIKEKTRHAPLVTDQASGPGGARRGIPERGYQRREDSPERIPIHS